MAIAINVDVMLAKRKMQSKELANKIGITPRNFSLLKTGKAKAIRLSTLNSICEALLCQPGDILEFIADDEVDVSEADTEEKRAAPTVEKPVVQMSAKKEAAEVEADSTDEKPIVEVSKKVKKVVKKIVKKKVPSSVKPTVSPTEATQERTGTNDSG